MIKSIVSGLAEPIANIVGKAVKDKDASARLNAEILQTILNVESDYTKEVASVIKAEANSQSWLARNWRPMMMLFFGGLLGSFWFGFAPEYVQERPELTEELFSLLKLGIGGYIVGRSVEKTAKTLSDNGGIKNVLGN